MRNSTIRYVLASAIALLLIACGEAKEQHQAAVPGQQVAAPAPAAKVDFPTGEVVEKVVCASDPSQSYALYLPKNYTHDKKWPVLYCFDSHADGVDPVKHYYILADAFETVLIGSNNSQNGQNGNQSLQIAETMIADSRTKLSLDPERTYVTGFSGGARVAAFLAQNRPDVAGVIGCAAGFQPLQGGRPFHYVGLVGSEDFNYQEMRRLDDVLDQTGHQHLVDFFVGGHEWPPVSFMARGVQWMHLRAMADGFIAKNDTSAQNMLTKFRRQDESLAAHGTQFQRWLLRKKIVSYLNGLADVSALEKEMADLAQHPDVVREKTRRDQELQREIMMRQQYEKALNDEDMTYWKRVTNMMQQLAKKGLKNDAWLNKRVLGFLSLSTYMRSSQALGTGKLDDAERFLKIYALVDPPNAEHQYLTAHLRMKQNKQAEALAALEGAVGLGFEDAARMESDPVLAPLAGQARFQKLLADLKAAKP